MRLFIFIFLIAFALQANTEYIKIKCLDDKIPFLVNRIKSLKIDDIGDRYVTAYINERDIKILKALGFKYKKDDPKNYKLSTRDAGYHDYNRLTQELKTLATTYTNLTTLISIGKTEENREQWIMKVSSSTKTEQEKRKLILIATMHGDEIIGQEILLKMIDYLASNYGKIADITKVIDDFEIWILPNMNPDGTAHQTRYTADGTDLNRDFPNFKTDPNNITEHRALETQNVMKFVWSKNFVLGLNYHGGAVVVSTLWDTVPELPPQNDLIMQIAHNYASKNAEMFKSEEFQDGVTNGYAWYEVDGSMQDWFYYYQKSMNFTVELSERKWPPFSELDTYWEENREALLSFIKQGYLF